LRLGVGEATPHTNSAGAAQWLSVSVRIRDRIRIRVRVRVRLGVS
jgi:hypothetical protein